MIQGTYWACCVHAPKSTSLQRLATVIELAGMRMPRSPTTVVVRSETAAELGQVAMIAVVGREGVNADVYLFPVQEPVGGSTPWQRRTRVCGGTMGAEG
jgi:hypothetical protein